MGVDRLRFVRARSALADTIICSSDPPPCERCRLTISQAFFICFFSTEDQEEILDRAELDPSLSNFTFRRTQHASCGYRAWISSLQTPPTMSLNTGDLCMDFNKRRLAATHLCMLWGTLRSCFRNSGCTTIYATHIWRYDFERQEYLLTLSAYHAGTSLSHIQQNGESAGEYRYGHLSLFLSARFRRGKCCQGGYGIPRQ